ncbi:MAG: ACT domain-containing protein [Pyrinomonadaceae bacterium]|nr:ACT domain-containing protein [Pyrinomonadaceae bacterium]
MFIHRIYANDLFPSPLVERLPPNDAYYDLVMDFNIVGFMATVAKILADANISIMALSAFSRDHLLIKQDDLAKALIVLGEYVEELC